MMKVISKYFDELTAGELYGILRTRSEILFYPSMIDKFIKI